MAKENLKLREHLSQTLVGCLKLRIHQELTKSDNLIADELKLLQYVLGNYRASTLGGKIVHKILNFNKTEVVRYRELGGFEPTADLIRRLERNPFGDTFIELTDITLLENRSLGILIFREDLVPSGCFYHIVYIDEFHFPSKVAGYINVRANHKSPNPIFAEYQQKGEQGETIGMYIENDLNSYQSSFWVDLAAKVFCFLDKEYPSELKFNEFDKIAFSGVDSTLNPPRDRKNIALLAQAYDEKIPVTVGMLNSQLIKPYSLDFCLSYPMGVLNVFKKRIIDDPPESRRILVYWQNDSFIMSDDYALYLAYRQLKVTQIPVAILGVIPENQTHNILQSFTGGAELIPSITLLQYPSYDQNDENLKELLLESKLMRGKQDTTSTKLTAIYLGLCTILNRYSVVERDLHNFLLKHPIAIDSLGSGVLSEVRLGEEYRVDLIFQYSTTNSKILLIELENSNKLIFTKNGRLRAEVTHAIQQVEDWLRWWKEHPDQVPSSLDYSVEPEGLVIIGRDDHMNSEAKKRLLHLNQNRKVQVITYDDLLARIEQMIESLYLES